MSPCEQLNCLEIKIATLVWRGNTNPEIARMLGSSEQVIKNHLRSVFDKLGVWSRLELALYVASRGGHLGGEPLSAISSQLPSSTAAAAGKAS